MNDMTVIILIVSIIGVVIISFIGWFIYFLKRNNQSTINIEPIQKDINHSKEILENQVKNLKEQLEVQNTIINTFKENWNVNDRDNNQKITTLITALQGFQGSLNKKEADYKLNAEEIKKQVGAVITDLATLKESSNVLGTINDNIQSLQQVFVNTKKRGNVGEYLLEKILTNMLGNNQKLWEKQYKTADGKIVDAYIKTEETKQGIAVDSKFSTDNYQKYFATEDANIKNTYLKTFRTDIKNRINEVAKYINPKNDISSAVMFVPSEEIFAFIYANYQEEVVDYAFNKRVWITSPTTLAAILFAIDKNMKDIQFNRNIEKIRTNLLKIKTEFDRWIDRWEAVKKGFNTTNTAINNLDKTHNKLANQYNNILLSETITDDAKESE
ncbi:MAG: DNA recombination protein RmuC [Spiroplasma sp.]|nr:DNA recombination protein RmuC [Spiroplasma sp.]